MSRIVGTRTKEVVNDCLKLLEKKGWPELPVDLDPPVGDFAIICFPASKILDKEPGRIAEELARELGKLDTVGSASFEKGYCNINLKWDDFASDFIEEIMGERYGKDNIPKEKILIEHTSANATGPFHMGRARNPIIGDSIARLLIYSGHDVKTEYYVNDTGRQAATLAYGLDHYELGKKGKKDHRLVNCYRRASKELKKNEATKNKIYNDMELIEGGDKKSLRDVRGAAEQMLEGMKLSLRRLKTEPDSYFHESDLLESGVVNDIIEKLKQSKLCGEENGAHYLDLEAEGIAGRNQKFFFTRKNGLSLYTTREIAYHLDKFTRCDKALNILGEDHRLQGRLLGIALRELESKEPRNLFYSFVNLPGGKMSTRAGRVVYLDDIMEQIVALAKEKLEGGTSQQGRWKADIKNDQREKLAEEIGIGALRYNILKVQAEKGFTFNIEEALNLQGDSAPFAMYSHARTSSIIRKFGKGIPKPRLSCTLENAEIRLLRTLAKWPGNVEKTASNLAIHNIPNYVHLLASDFNQFYRDCPVIGNDNENFRINLVNCSQKILRQSLAILGIKAPDRM
ncbi:MAG: arginine--tRNA ligase [Candidatus Thermoplasmatota archaeon]|nr:arginine--tRNA ligase [Candidatus Thermoplasmatota archaeon]